MKRDPSIARLLLGDLLARSPLGFGPAREEMLEALFDGAPAYTQRDPRDPGIALIEALAATLDIFGFYHDRILTESKIGAAQLLQSVAQLGDIVGYTPRPALAAVARQFFEARAPGVVAGGSKLAARPTDAPGKVIFETLRALTIGPAFNRMALDPIIARHIGAMRAVLRRLTTATDELVTPLDEFPASALTMINGLAGLELSPITGARSRAIAVGRPLRRSYGLIDTRVQCVTEYRHLRNGHRLSDPSPAGPQGHDDLIAFEVSDRPILHIPDPAAAQRLRSTLELFVFDASSDPRDPGTWTPARRWEEVPDFSASEAADHHYRTIVDDRLCTYVLLRRAMGYRTLLSQDELDRVYVRFAPAVGDLVAQKLGVAPPELTGFVVHLNDEYFRNPLVLPMVDGEPVRTLPSDWVVTDRSLDLVPGRQIIIENADTGEKFIRTLGPRTLDQYLNWRHISAPHKELTESVVLPPRPLWDRIFNDVIAAAPADPESKGLFLQTFGHYFPLGMPDKNLLPAPEDASYPVLPGHGALHAIPDRLLFVERIPEMHAAIAGWSKAASLSISPLRSAAKAGPYHLWDQFYREFENLDWALTRPDSDENDLLNLLDPAPQAEQPDEVEENYKLLWKDDAANGVAEATIVPRGSTFIIVQDTALIRPGDYFLLGKRLRYHKPPPPESDPSEEDESGRMMAVVAGPDDLVVEEYSAFDPHWHVAEVLQAVEVQGKIVRLKWPTQNEYTVDFLYDTVAPEPPEPLKSDLIDPTTLKQPATELIIVPQVASVFYGEKFRQTITLMPNQVLREEAEEVTAPDMQLVALKSRLNAGKLRKRTNWPDLDEAPSMAEAEEQLAATWPDMFFAHIVDDPASHIVVGVPEPGKPSLTWTFLVRATNKANLPVSHIVGLLIGLPEPAAIFDLYELAPIQLHNETPSGFAFAVPANDLAAAWNDPALAAAPENVQVWARTDATKFEWKDNDVKWFPGQSELILADLLPFSPENPIPEGAILRLDGSYARVVANIQGTLSIEMLGNADLPAQTPVVRLHALPATPSAPVARAFLMLGGAALEPPPVFLPGPLVEGGDDPDDFVAQARYPQKHQESGKYFLASYEVEADYTAFMAAVEGATESSFYYFENKIDQLDEASYLARHEYNFLRRWFVKAFVLAPGADLQGGKFLLFSLSNAADGVDGMAGELGEQFESRWQFLTESVIFNSGNFIPVRLGNPDVDHNIVANSIEVTIASTGQKVEYAADLRDLRAEIKALVQEMDANGGLDYLEPQFRFSFNKTPEGTFTLNFLFMANFPKNLDNGLDIHVDVVYTAEPYQPKPGEKDVGSYRHEAKYTVCKDEPLAVWVEKRLYQFETRPLPWNPLRQLVILNTGDLKAGDYLFIDPSGVNAMSVEMCEKPAPLPPSGDVDAAEAVSARDYIQWTRVVEVDGRMVMVDPPVKIQPRGFYHYRVSGYRRPATAALPDPDYYKLLQSEDKPDPSGTIGPRQLSYGNRLMLQPFAEIGVNSNDGELVPIQRKWLLDNLVPGDRLLVWDERWRSAWHDHRVNGEQVEPDEPHWYDWPDRQHEVVIKRIIPRLGLVELELRMPPRFGVEYEGEVVVPDGKTTASVINFRALPFYREPFQGRRELFAVGDGDRRVKFARFLGLVEQNFGLASVVLDKPGTLASNIEVLTLDRSAGEWQRWTEFTRIDTARAKDRAFVLGLTVPTEYPPGCEHVVGVEPGTPESQCSCPEPADMQPRDVGTLAAADLTSGAMALAPTDTPTSEFSVSFGDGVTGQLLPNGKANVFARPVEIGRWCVHFHGPVERRILQLGSGCLPFRIAPTLASAKNLVLLVEHGAHHHWQPRAGEQRWRPSILVEIDLRFIVEELQPSPELLETLAELERELPQDKILRLREVSDAEALEGRDGVLVRPVRPGVVELYVAAKFDLASIITAADPQGDHALALHVKVFEEARTETWRLDEHFYKDILDNDPTAGDGAGIVLLAETEGLAEGSLLGFNASGAPDGEVEVVEVASVDHATYSATLTSGLTRTYDLDRSYLFGNLVEVVQGSSERQVLGSGDGSTRNLRLAVGNREPILHSKIHARAPGELAPGVVVLVDDIPWERVDSLEGRGPRDRMYCLDVEASGRSHVRFGDGQSGAIPAAGLDNIIAVVRLGDGARGNVPAGAIDKLLDGNLAVERTRNVTAGVGGKAADDVAQAREHLMTRSFTHGRAITRDDLVAAVRSLSNVVQAQLDPSADTGVVRMVIALADRQPASDDQLRALEQRIAGTMPVAAGVSLELVDAVHVGIHVVLEVSVNQGYFEGEVVKDLERAFAPQDDGFFALERWPIGAPLRVGDIYEHAFSLPGVATARVRWMSRGVEPMELPAATAEILRVEPGQVIRCDSDRTGDPYRARGSFRVQIKRGGR
jgi:hypothetical protein